MNSSGWLEHAAQLIRNADVVDQPSWADVETQVATALSGRVLVAHNATVERGVLRAHLPGWEPSLVLDTLRLARHVWPGLAAPENGLW